MLDHNFQKSEKIFPHDYLVKWTVLWLFPRWIKPNHITVFRFLTTPIVAFLMYYGHYWYGLIAFLLVAFTDTIDGSIARTRDEITEWGKVYDPLADKILISTVVFIIVLKYVGYWTAILIITIEVAIIITAWFRKYRGAKIQANIWGKIKMLLQVLGVTLLLVSIVFGWGEILPLASGTLYVAIAFAIVSLLTYGI